VAHFTTNIHQLGLADNDGVALDLEVTDGRTPAQVSAWAVQVMEALANQLNRTPVIYTFLSFAGAGTARAWATTHCGSPTPPAPRASRGCPSRGPHGPSTST
jgi:hypothetical protein